MKYLRGQTLALSLASALGVVAWANVPQGSAESFGKLSPTELHAYQPRGLGQLQQVALDLANRDRTQHGRSPLQPDPLLSQAAQRHAEDMLRRNYFSHYTPEGRTPSDRFAAVGGTGGAAENIVMLRDSSLTKIGPSKLAYFEKGWMNSAGHRQNLLNDQYGRFGYGIATSGGRVFAVQLFTFP